jgi:hypothetical protein
MAQEDGQPATSISQEMWMEMMSVNLNSVLILCQHFIVDFQSFSVHF